ncbi:WD repeat-containing protein 26 homolog [Bidens hawaiensis]|uniref:WD repeat-containing protein 26 homolog n=1 Tax=Bidens hawaiensis TaxID=980011 RepID=UPI00404B659B
MVRKGDSQLTSQILEEHAEEVSFLLFSHSGSLLAFGSKDGITIIWAGADVNNNNLFRQHTLQGHGAPICCLAWSPNDQRLLTCGLQEDVRCWDVLSGASLRVYRFNDAANMISCHWCPDGQKFLTGMTNGTIAKWDLEGHARTFGTVDLYAEVNQIVNSFVLAGDDLLISLLNNDIILRDMDDMDLKVSATYTSRTCTTHVIRACSGGPGEALIASGSEDSQVFIWNRRTGELLKTLGGHVGRADNSCLNRSYRVFNKYPIASPTCRACDLYQLEPGEPIYVGIGWC